MKQHPVPQNISSYQFRLIGEMTLKQFLELIAGFIAAWLIYTLNVPVFIKFPFIFLAIMGGVALAFLPIEERPLDVWIVNFFKAVYSPTQYVWKKRNPIPLVFQNTTYYHPLLNKQTKELKKDRGKLEEYLKTLPSSSLVKSTNKIEEDEDVRLKNIFNLLGPSPLDKKRVNVPGEGKAVIKTKIRQLAPQTDIKIVPKQVFPKEIAVPEEQVFKKSLKKAAPATGPIVKPAPRLNPPILVDSTKEEKLDPSVAAQFSTTLPIPQTPETPNLVVGMVISDYDKIITGALIEILNQNNETVRALKTNKLGQFFSASPLNSGVYQIKVEHPGWEFDIIKLKAEGKIILPIKIKAKNRKKDP